MEGQFVNHKITFDKTSFSCPATKIDGELWFKAHDAAVFLDYKKPSQAIQKNVPPEARKQWDSKTVLISEGGLYRLFYKPEGIRFEKWVFDEVLPAVRKFRSKLDG